MSIWRLIAKEILYRKLNFGLGVASVLAAVACLVGELTLLNRFDRRTDEIIAAKEAETRQRMQELEVRTRAQMQALEDDYRKITLKLGFNILVLPKDQNLADLYADDYASKVMPEDYAERLSKSQIVTINHLLPTLQQKLKWPEQERTILLVGTRGEIPLLGRGEGPVGAGLVPAPMGRPQGAPLQVAVPPGTMVMGYELHRSLGLKQGDKVKLLGKEFTLGKLHPERGTKDDITVWIDLKEAQQLFKMEGKINAILALSCQCEGPRLPRIRKEIAEILPNTQVIEFASQAIARAEARDRAAAAAKAAIDQGAAAAKAAVEAEHANRAKMRAEREGFAALLVPLVIIGCTVWIGFLAFSNARDRSAEIGILRALGLGSSDIFVLFLGKAVLVGLVGAALGYVAGIGIGAACGEADSSFVIRHSSFDVALLAWALGLGPVLSALACWIPAMMAARQDPAVVLREG